jgi:hypothetical protein
MPLSGPFLTSSDTSLWLKVFLSAATLLLLYVRYRRPDRSLPSPGAYSFRAKVILVFAVVFAFAVFHSFGKPRSGTLLHRGEMFHYYLGTKYFRELGYYKLYTAVIAADAEQDNALATLPFYTDLTTYQNVRRETALRDADSVKGLFSTERWDAFKEDVSFFKKDIAMPANVPSVFFFVMDHGYNASPVSTSVLGMITNAVPVTQLPLLAAIDVLLMVAMIVIVCGTFGFEMGVLFSVYFFVNILNDHGSISGSLLRYDWLFSIVAAVCLLEKKRPASSAFFLILSAMIRVFPLVLVYGVAVVTFRKFKTARAVDQDSRRFILAAAVTGLVLFLLPAVCLGSVLQPWKDFSEKTALHDRGVYVNHLGLRGIVLFEPSQLSLERFVQTFRNPTTNDVVRHWQDVKEREFREKRPLIVLCSLFVLGCLTAILWKGKEEDGESGSAVWPLLLVYAMSYPSHYYYAFLCLFVLLFFKRANTLGAFVPLCLLLVLNIAALVTDSFSPSPIVFYTLVNIYLFLCLASILGFELYWSVFRTDQAEVRSAVAKKKRSRLSRANSRR